MLNCSKITIPQLQFICENIADIYGQQELEIFLNSFWAKALWVCPECGALHDRDINASINILEKSRTGSAVEPVDTLRNGVIEQENLSQAI